MLCPECGFDMELNCEGDYDDMGWVCPYCGHFIPSLEDCGAD